MNRDVVISVIVLNLNGREHLEPCFTSIANLDHPRERLEVLMVDNGSSDDSVAYVRESFPFVRVMELGRNHGYAAAMNRGCNEATGEILLFLNNDTRADAAMVAHLIRPILEGGAAATGAKILSWDGKEMHFAGGGTNFHGIAFQHGMGDADGPNYSVPGETLFACGAAMAIRRDIFHEVGGFDEDFFAYYEDVDLGWRLWVLGHRVRYVPNAKVYHHHSATSLRIPIHRVRVLHLRNPILMLFKNYDEASLSRIMSAALLLSARRTWYLAGVDDEDFRIGDVRAEPAKRGGFLRRDRNHSEFEESMSVRKLGISDLVAVNDIVAALPGLRQKRDWIQARRRRPDAEILPLFLDPFRCAEGAPEYAKLQDELCETFGIHELFRNARAPES